MLHIYNEKMAPPVGEPPMMEDTNVEPPTDMPMEAPEESIHRISQQVARYIPPEQGPFKCGNCLHYNGDGSCAIVDGPIDEEGVCSIFETLNEPPTEETSLEDGLDEAVEEPIVEDLGEEDVQA